MARKTAKTEETIPKKATKTPAATKAAQAPAPEAAASAPEQAAAPTSEQEAGATTPEPTDAPTQADNQGDDGTDAPTEAPVHDVIYRYRRKKGYRATQINHVSYGPGDIFESNTAGAIPAAFMDGWDILNEPDFTGEIRLPIITPTEGGFDVFTAEGRKLNDRPLPLKRAKALVDELGS